MSRTYRALVIVMRAILGVFFRRIEISGIENVPESAGGIIVAWHPNALVDPALIFSSFPGRIVFGARHGLFAWPVVGSIMRAIGCVPIYRAQDFPKGDADDARREANRKSLDAMSEAIAGGAFTALFPEGMSHDDPSPRVLKTGAARIFYQSLIQTPADRPPPVLLPVGLHYDEKRLLGSSVLIVYHPPLELEPELRQPPPAIASDESSKAQYRALTEKIEQTLKNIVHATENWEIHALLNRGRKLVRAERAARAGATLEAPDMAERVRAFSRLWTGYNERRRTHPDEVRKLLARIRRYDAQLAALAIEDHELDAEPSKSENRQTVTLVLRSLAVVLLFPPILVFGYLVNLPPAALVWFISKRRSKLAKDEATIKLLAGTVAFPVAWLVAALIVDWIPESLDSVDSIAPTTAWLLGSLTFVLCGVSGILTLRYQRFALLTLRAIRLRMTHSDHASTLRELRAKRSAICDDIEELASGLELPGDVQDDGRVVDAGSS
jgi:1-acyl-sn-glycerol-3-phosphate acyltransferase